MAAKKDKMMADYLAQEWKVGDEGTVKAILLEEYPRDPQRIEYVKVMKVLPDNKLMVHWKTDYDSKIRDTILDVSQISRSTFNIGSNPFPDKAWNRRIRTTNYNLEGIMLLIGTSGRVGRSVEDFEINGIHPSECNFNPYVIKDGEKLYYQRDFCWTLKDKQLFIESIYQSINCGMVLLRKRSFKYVEEQCKKCNPEVGFFDVVDGKQRLGCIVDFVNDKFQDMHGNYYSDLSSRAQHLFRNSQVLTYGEMEEGTTDEDVIEAFLHVNFTGVPMSQEHIDYVKEISQKLSEK